MNDQEVRRLLIRSERLLRQASDKLDDISGIGTLDWDCAILANEIGSFLKLQKHKTEVVK